MSQYRRSYVPGGVYFLTLVTYRRIPLFSNVENISLLRQAIAKMRKEKPFEITAAVVLPDHLHFIWSLPADDCNYSQRISRFKVLFTEERQRAEGSYAEGKKVKKCPLSQGLKPLNLFMKKERNMYFETHSARNTTSLVNPLNLFMGIHSCPLPSA